MEWLEEILGLGGLAAMFWFWAKGYFKSVVPSPARVVLAVANRCRGRPQPAEDAFRLVLCWLMKDNSGDDTETVAQALAGVDGIALVRSARTVAAPGAGDEWRPAMQKGTRAVLKDWHADLAIVGRVKRPGEALSLWFVPRLGEGTLRRGDAPYRLEDVTLGRDFHGDLRAQIAAAAFTSVAPLADTEVRGRILGKGLRDATEKLSRLVSSRTIGRGGNRSVLCTLLGLALQTLGERESGTERLEQAVEVHRDALSEDLRERAPLGWAAVVSGLAMALVALGSRERGTARLEEAVETYRAALEECTSERAPFQWAELQNNFGNALTALGERKRGTAHLEQALHAYRAVLAVDTRQRDPIRWALMQNNLGTALALLGEREIGTTYLTQAASTFRMALQEFPRERFPLYWAMAQHNIGNALRVLGERESGTESLEQAVAAYRAALLEYTPERNPHRWETTQKSLGAALRLLDERQQA